MIHNPSAPDRSHRNARIILRSEIEEAQRHTNSNAGAARWLNISYKIYKKYATLYGIFDRHLNPTGKGLEKGFAKNPASIPLRDILAGKHPKYSLAKLKNRLIARNKIEEACAVCGFHERRITDKRMPLMLTFIDGDHSNFTLTNLQLRCYNCMFLTTGAPSVVNKTRHITRSFTAPDTLPQTVTLLPTTADAYDSSDDDIHYTSALLTDEEKEQLLASLDT
jgi:hypothetical protein